MKRRFVRFVSFLLAGILLITIVGCSAGDKTVKCLKCGKENAEAAKFCIECGDELSSSTVADSDKHNPNKDDQDEYVEEDDDSDEDDVKESTSSEGTFTESSPAESIPTESTSAENTSSESNSTEPVSTEGASTADGTGESSPAEKKLLRECYVKATAVTLKFYYDRNGYLVGRETWSEDGKMTFQSVFTNDSNGNCTQEYIPLYEQLGFNSRIDFENTYDTKGRLVKAYNVDWGSYDQYYYEDDELVKVLHVDSDAKESYEEYEGGRLIRTSKNDVITEYYYNDQGKCTGTSDENLTVDEWGNITEDAVQTYKYITLTDYIAQNLHLNEYTNGSINSGGSTNQGGNSSSGGNSGGSSTPSICTGCGGSGLGDKCIGCEGTGQYLAYYDINHNPVYFKCTPCKGTGYIICRFCGGDGYR